MSITIAKTRFHTNITRREPNVDTISVCLDIIYIVMQI